MFWVDGAIPLEKYLELKSYQVRRAVTAVRMSFTLCFPSFFSQRINHFPGMGEISRKDSLARNMQRSGSGPISGIYTSDMVALHGLILMTESLSKAEPASFARLYITSHFSSIHDCRMQRINQSDYCFFPTTWVLPADHGSLASHMCGLRKKKRRKTFIVKPHNGAMGNG